MISYLSGTIIHKSLNSAIMSVNGVGYKVFIPNDVMTKIQLNEPSELFIHTHVGESILDLYGFNSMEDLTLFELLIGVSGIGPKTALGIFTKGTSDKIKTAIVKGDVALFTSVPRLGTKNAQKIIIELRSKLGSLQSLDLNENTSESQEIIEALKQLGFSPQESREALRHIESEGNVSDKIRKALKILGKNSRKG
ncbi:Holliday junction DNA helicase RuvA [Candidatus Gottesmanbacteria bacterium RIFCSPHIGHO2_02_FULL_39_11]|uniref:Holliday junction branch migration complex subunit RuvA n=1 Tax=Candidatus Gottesmanbacteria bacterium RIFCSPHIGHO2_02_FULL_39_11 TaxID=1798382 RepID=A0A1F5ZL13_9BACT|nr:MAG: Holliday junction DNA helicase RuvA [Candidatus Gottesmanbacteria bacterium RIFCSPHIGHO2_02_FULL_39_11]